MMTGGKITIFFRHVTAEVVSLHAWTVNVESVALKNMKLRGKSSEDIVKELEERGWYLDLIKTHYIHYGIFNDKVIIKRI